ncbi:hypothetical protein GQ53DRAFT_803744 [Thozetella sp. PMI_491]|nr:hypothetical protein GQ53DRAFT_803744 [Thozetella sp. PMI_491]
MTEQHSSPETGGMLQEMVRRKSGEIVWPVLRTSSHHSRSSASASAKFVHFNDSQLEQVRHFFREDQPRFISSSIPGSNPADEIQVERGEAPEPPSPPLPLVNDLTIQLLNFPLETAARRKQPVRLLRTWLSRDYSLLYGSVGVANTGENKRVVCRFSFDNWETTDEAEAFYNVTRLSGGYECFVFSVDLAEVVDIMSKPTSKTNATLIDIPASKDRSRTTPGFEGEKPRGI